MRIVEKYSHLNGEEYLLVHHRVTYRSIRDVVKGVDASKCVKKKSREKTMRGKMLFAPKVLNKAFEKLFAKDNWSESRYRYVVSTDRHHVQEMVGMTLKEQRAYLKTQGVNDPIESYKQTDFVKDRIAIEVQFGKYAFVAFDLFVKHLLFYSGDVIDVGVEILPMKEMMVDPSGGRRMSTGIAYFEGEVYNLLRHGRNSPPVPLLILGVAP